MSTEIIALTPEDLDLANAYLQYGSAHAVAEQTGIPEYAIIKSLERKDVKSYINGVYLDRGYRNRQKIADVMDKIIDSKLEEALESEVYSTKDLLEIMKFAHQIRMDEAKLAAGGETNSPTVNIANFGAGNYGQLMEKLLK